MDADYIPKHFGLTIAFLAPGLLGVYALSFFAPPVADWLGLATRQDVNLGGFLFALIAATGMGVFISGLRWLAIEWAMPKCPKVDYKALSDPNVERVVEFARIHHYQFYQFYSNTLCALVLVFGAWWWTANPRPELWPAVGARFLLLLATCGVLFASARDCLIKHDEKVGPSLSASPIVQRP
jgi:hypothetical protein